MSFILELDYDDPNGNNLPCLSCRNLCEEYRALQRMVEEYLWQKDQLEEVQRDTDADIRSQDLEDVKASAISRCESVAEKIETEDCYRD
jgi:hypothetical protein